MSEEIKSCYCNTDDLLTCLEGTPKATDAVDGCSVLAKGGSWANCATGKIERDRRVHAEREVEDILNARAIAALERVRFTIDWLVEKFAANEKAWKPQENESSYRLIAPYEKGRKEGTAEALKEIDAEITALKSAGKEGK